MKIDLLYKFCTDYQIAMEDLSDGAIDLNSCNGYFSVLDKKIHPCESKDFGLSDDFGQYQCESCRKLEDGPPEYVIE